MRQGLLALALAFPLLGFAPPAGSGPDAGETGETGERAPPPAPSPGPAPSAPSTATPPAKLGAPITVTTRLTPDPSHIGDLLTIEVIVAYPRDHSINLPNGLDFSPLELVEVHEGEVESTGNDLRQRFTITLQHFAVGEAEVPSFPVTWIDPQNAVHTYAVAPHPFVVESLLINEADPQVQGEDPMISLEYPNVRAAIIIWSVIGGVVLAGMLAALGLWWRRRERPVVLPPPIPPHQRAFEDLDELARHREELIAAGAYQDYYLRLTEIAKRYLGARFGFEALDRTTEEIQDLLGRGHVRVEPLDPKRVLTFLQDCDLVKFARLSPPEDEAREALQDVREMVERSMPREPIEQARVEQAAGEAQEGGAQEGGAQHRDPARARAVRPVQPEAESTQAPEPASDAAAEAEKAAAFEAAVVAALGGDPAESSPDAAADEKGRE